MIALATLGVRSFALLITGAFLIPVASPASAQQPVASTATGAAEQAPPLEETVRQDGPVDGRFGFGTPNRPEVPCLTPEQRNQIQMLISASVTAIAKRGLLPPKLDATVLLDWPIQAVGSAAQGFGVHGISNFVDQDPAFPDQVLDYNCGARSYDLASGYNHRGIDIFSWPFPWIWMDADEVHVVAAAPGVIILKSNGNFDESCGLGGGNWNAVYVRHADGSIAWYGHLKNNSLTTKSVGQLVSAGEFLGVMGSSGNSTGPHLHLELYDGNGSLVEPFSGPCNAMNAFSWWADQRPYYDPAVNRMTIGSAAVSFPPCPGRAVTNEVPALSKGSLGYFTTFYRDQLSSLVSQYKVLRPNGTIFQSWSHSSAVPHYAASWWWWSWFIPNGEPSGVWTFQVVFDGATYERTFNVN